MASKLLMCGLAGVAGTSSRHFLRTAPALQKMAIHTSNLVKSEEGKGGLFAPDAAVDKSGKANRWSMFVPAFVTHVCLGAPYGWSAISGALAREYGFVAASAGDWALSSATYCINQVVTNPTGPMAPAYLGLFCASTVASLSILGGVFAVLPAYEADLYGPKYVQAIHGRFLICASLSTVAGPTILLTLRKMSENAALQDLLAKVDPAKFQGQFGVDVSQANALIEAKTLTISKLMTIMPQGTVDPSPFIYNNTMYTMAGLVGVASALHFMVKPVDKKHFEKTE